MYSDPIPEWNAQGVISPIDVTDPTSTFRSPYWVKLTDLPLRFSQSDERREILSGLLKYRSELHKLNIRAGFQWLDGSFMENIEILESRPPGDIDVVTFYRLPEGETQRTLLDKNPDLFDSQKAEERKARYHVDAYLVSLNSEGERLVSRSAYWYSVWAHRRSALWKGFLQIDLAQTDDKDALSLLTSLPSQGGQS